MKSEDENKIKQEIAWAPMQKIKNLFTIKRQDITLSSYLPLPILITILCTVLP